MEGAAAAILIFAIFMILCFLTVPIGISIGTACVIYFLLGGSVNMDYITTNMFTGCDSFPLMAIPFFVLSGALMEGGGLSKRLVDFFDAFVGHKTGGLDVLRRHLRFCPRHRGRHRHHHGPFHDSARL